MDKDKLIQRLMETFLGELEEHVHALNRDLLALEKEPIPPAKNELFKTLFRTAHSLKGAARSVNVSAIEEACHRLEDTFVAARDGHLAMGPDLFQLLFATADAIQEVAKRLRLKQELAGATLPRLLPRLEAAAKGTAQAQPQPTTETPSEPSRDTGFVRVPAAKLDALLTRSGELLVARNRGEARGEDVISLQEFVKRWQAEWPVVEKVVTKLLRRNGTTPAESTPPNGANRPSALSRRAALALGRNKDNLRRLGRELERLAAGLAGDRHALEQSAGPLEEEVRRVRMLPFAEACEGLERMVRDLAVAGAKEVDLVVEGGDVELDRSILEALRDPLLHLVRNAVDHGIETTAERRAAGKPARGRVSVAAALRGARVEVVVEDDGRGLDLAAIREQALKKKLPESDDPRELVWLIFLPGFSTSRIVTELSGRGVGLDVVKTRVESMHGAVDLHYEPGRGTRFLLTAPLTLTTIRALLVASGGQTFAIPSTSVQKLLRTGPDDLRSVEGREVLLLGGAPVPVMPLAELLGLRAREPARSGGKAPVVVLSTGNHPMAFMVDELLAEQEVLVKRLGPRLMRVRHVTGATVLPNGRFTLILNTSDLIRSALGRTPSQTLSAVLAEAAPEAKKRLLLVEDSVTTRTLEKTILEAAGFEVIAAVDGTEAWQLLQEKGADLVVADIEMPRMDGFALTEAIRSSKRFRDLPVVLVTALESEKDKARGMEVGANAYLLKSAFDQKNLLETIGQLL